MDWKQVEITTTPEGVEPLTAACLELGIGGLEIRDPGDIDRLMQGQSGRWDYLDEALLARRGNPAVVAVYLSDTPQGEDVLRALDDTLRRLRTLDAAGEWGPLSFAVSTVREEDWANAWKQYYAPTPVGKRLVVCPSWEQYAPEPGQVVIRLDPGMAFGTGTHHSTRLCLALLEDHLPPGGRMLDLGCGSGILAVSGLLLGAGSAVGVDIDEVAVRVARENAELNAVAGQCRFFCGDLAQKAEGKFDLICANIVADVILGFLPLVGRYLKPGGVFLASGIIDSRAAEVLAALPSAGLRLLESREAGGWAALAIQALAE